MTRGIVVACLLCGLSLLCGCLEGPTGPQGEKGDTVLVKEESSIVGIWIPHDSNANRYTDSTYYIILRDDDSYSASAIPVNRGKYKVNGDTITFTRDDTNERKAYRFILNKDWLTLINENDAYSDYFRATE